MSAARILGATELAEALGVSRQMVYQYEREGKIRRRDGGYDLAEVRQQLASNLGSKRGGAPRRQTVSEPKNPAKAGGKFDHISKADLEKAELAEDIRKKKRLNDLEEKRLVRAYEIDAYISGMQARAKDIFLRMGPELRDKLAQETDPVRCEDIVMAEVYRGLNALAEYRPDA